METIALKTKSNEMHTLVGTKRPNWLALVVVGWVLLLGFSFYEKLRPASDWMEVHSLTIANTVIGSDPVMDYKREIKQPFAGHWISEVQIQNKSGKWTATCIATGVANYSPDKEPPDPLTLKWWTYPIDCTPTTPGFYRVVTTWQINWPGERLSPDNQLSKQTSVTSNTFRVAGL